MTETLTSIAKVYRTLMVALLGAMMAILFAVMCVQVFFRYGLNNSLIWAEEVCRYLLIWVSFLACGVAYQRGEIAAMRILVEALPARAAALLTLIADVAILVLLAFLVVFGWRYAVFSGGQTMPAADFIWSDVFHGEGSANLSLFWVYVSIPISMALLAVHIVIHTLSTLKALAGGTPPTSPSELGSAP
ncbi:TRAP transporter small permease [Microbaculum marinisediminis]|uniref:TRAP transporter small permease protein n=1 Tax=Microbaculum marinisediminis TaxID=2931392 RepID=A0AAW5R5L0_9HYPH|nr:TRAP transporter small permease [Microbaculum sp. A6E488]MCT8973963.1 TRAP transporter small permease [Microbaculum sp. A6E488]